MASKKPTYKIAKKSEVMHLIKMGGLFAAFYDLETTSLDKRYAQITQFGGWITDLAGNILHSAEYAGKETDECIIEPEAWVVQRLNNEQLSKGESQYVIAGRIGQFFRQSNSLHEAPFRQAFLDVCRPGTYTKPDQTTEKYFSYPVQNDDGSIDWDCIRIHENLKKFYYFDEQSNQWIKQKIGATAYGYNNVRADDPWIWTNQHMAASGNIFPTHMAQTGMHRVDILRVVETMVAAGSKGENGIKPGKAIHPITKEEHLSFSQGAILKANTKLASTLRGIVQGITMPDSSFPDLEQLHGASQDALTLYALVQHLRSQEPDIMRQMEQNSDWKAVIQRLSAQKEDFGNRPPITYIDKSYPYLTGKMVSLIGADEERNRSKLALVVNLGIAPETFIYNGKELKDVTPAEFAVLIETSRRDQNGLFKVIQTHHCPRLLDKETGFAAGFNDKLDYTTLLARAQYWQNPTLTENAMAGLRRATPMFEGPEGKMLPQPEEELFHSLSLRMHDRHSNSTIQLKYDIRSAIERHVFDSWTKETAANSLWFQAIEPDENILLNDFSNDPEEEKAARAFHKKIKDLNKKIVRKNGTPLPEPEQPVTDKKGAWRYKIKLLFYAREHFSNGTLRDIGHRYWFEDKQGRRKDENEIKKWDMTRLDDHIKSGNLTVRHETIEYSAHIIDRILVQLGCADLLHDKVETVLAGCALRHHGIPALNGDDRWTTLLKAKRRYQKIRNNELPDSDMKAPEDGHPGLWEVFTGGHNDAQASLAEYRLYLDQKIDHSPALTEERLCLLGINPESGMPLDKTDYDVNTANVHTVTVPERYLENPPLHPVSRQPIWLLRVSKKFNQMSLAAALNAGQEIVLTGHATGKRYHLPKASAAPIPQPGGAMSEFYDQVSARYTESNLPKPKEDKLIALSGEGPYILHNLLPPDLNTQSLHIPKPHFEALMDHRIASYMHKVCGIVLRDEGLTLQKGSVRLLEKSVKGDKPTGWYVETNITGAKRYPLEEIEEFSDERAHQYGFLTSHELASYVSRLFSKVQLKPRDKENKVWVVDFGDVRPFDENRGTRFYDPSKRKISALNTGCRTLTT